MYKFEARETTCVTGSRRSQHPSSGNGSGRGRPRPLQVPIPHITQYEVWRPETQPEVGGTMGGASLPRLEVGVGVASGRSPGPKPLTHIKWSPCIVALCRFGNLSPGSPPLAFIGIWVVGVAYGSILIGQT